jgi:hypothetical protein
LVVVTEFDAYTFPVTSSEAAGVVVPIPVRPELFTKIAEALVDVTRFIKGPAPSCLTVSAVDAVFPNTKQLLVFSTVGKLGAP